MVPATAGASEFARAKAAREWTGGPRIHEQRAEQRGFKRLAYASLRQSYHEEGARPHHQHRWHHAQAPQNRYTKRRHVRSAARRHPGHRIARRSGGSRHASLHRAHEHRSAEQGKRPATGAHGSGLQGVASYYWEPQRLASGGWFNPNALTAAHRSLPFGTRVRVTHQGSGRSVEVTINDRGPYIAGRIIDLSRAAANVIGMTAQGVAKVRVEVLGH
jgi:rare lipoprotein A